MLDILPIIFISLLVVFTVFIFSELFSISKTGNVLGILVILGFMVAYIVNFKQIEIGNIYVRTTTLALFEETIKVVAALVTVYLIKIFYKTDKSFKRLFLQGLFISSASFYLIENVMFTMNAFNNSGILGFFTYLIRTISPIHFVLFLFVLINIPILKAFILATLLHSLFNLGVDFIGGQMFSIGIVISGFIFWNIVHAGILTIDQDEQGGMYEKFRFKISDDFKKFINSHSLLTSIIVISGLGINNFL